MPDEKMPDAYKEMLDKDAFKDVHFDGLTDLDKVVIVIPSALVPASPVPPFEVLETMRQLREHGIETRAERIDLSFTVQCWHCNQDCSVMEPVPQGFTPICWDCIEEQAPGFIENVKAGKWLD